MAASVGFVMVRLIMVSMLTAGFDKAPRLSKLSLNVRQDD